MSEQLVVNAAIAGATYAVIACGFNVAFRVLGYYYVVFGALLAIAGTATHWAAVSLGLPWPIATLIGILASGLVALADFLVVYSPLATRKASGLTLFLASTAMYFVLTNSLLFAAGPEARTFPTSDFGVLAIGEARLPVTGLLLVVGAAAIWGGLFLGLGRTRLGLAMRAVSDNAEMVPTMLRWLLLWGCPYFERGFSPSSQRPASPALQACSLD